MSLLGIMGLRMNVFSTVTPPGHMTIGATLKGKINKIRVELDIVTFIALLSGMQTCRIRSKCLGLMAQLATTRILMLLLLSILFVSTTLEAPVMPGNDNLNHVQKFQPGDKYQSDSKILWKKLGFHLEHYQRRRTQQSIADRVSPGALSSSDQIGQLKRSEEAVRDNVVEDMCEQVRYKTFDSKSDGGFLGSLGGDFVGSQPCDSADNTQIQFQGTQKWFVDND
ncbi:hypothetical protein AKJ16_DCAP25555 [Drosera capensis]